jgi:AcrR family transcriptional regulator
VRRVRFDVVNDALEASRRADRPRRHTGSSATEVAIFEATERLLATQGLHDISVADILEEAGISRATFYFYFSSKFAVVTGMLGRLYEEIFEVVQPFISREEDESPEQALRRSLQASADVWTQHQAAMRAVHEHWAVVPELRAAWLEIVERFTDALAAAIDRDRAAGLAVNGPSSHQLAAMLLWSTDRCLYVASLGVDDDLLGERETVEPLMAIWMGAVYGAEPVAKRATRGRGTRKR